MKLSEYTLSVLKNFANINSGVVLRPGNVQKTMSDEQSILVEAELEEAFPQDFGVYDLNQFLGNISTLGDPELEFHDKWVNLKDSDLTVKYFGCDASLIKSPPAKGLTLDNPDVTFDLTNATLSKLLKLASMNVLPHLSIVGENGELLIKTHEKGNDTSNSVESVNIGKTDKTFVASFKTENIKLLPDDYTVDIKLGAFAKFTSKTKKITYFIALVTK